MKEYRVKFFEDAAQLITDKGTALFRVDNDGYLVWESGDLNVSDEEFQLYRELVEFEKKKLASKAAAALGSIKTAKKAAASRANGARGGRPKIVGEQ